MTQAYPLQWPEGRHRRSIVSRKESLFKTDGRALSIADAVRRLQAELDRLGARYPVISCNVEPRLDGLPRSGGNALDPAVAVYFQLGGKPHCLPCDTFTTVAGNIAAVAAHIEATRKIERYGVATVAEQFAGFAALPPPEKPKPKWWEVLGIPANAERWMIDAAYKQRAKERHPDAGGTAEAMAELNEAKAEADKERGK